MAKVQILGPDGEPLKRTARSDVAPRATIDATKTNHENRRHWANADSFSADAAFDPTTRGIARNRSRYEWQNNCYVKGAVKADADDMIGTGPRWQITLPGEGDDREALARQIEASFHKWANEVLLPIDLRVLEASYVRDGGALGIADTAPDLKHPVKLFIRFIEDEQCRTPWAMSGDPMIRDGVEIDRLGRPQRYFILKEHPGGLLTTGSGFVMGDFTVVPADRVLHWFPRDRFGQHRGIPEITPSLPIHAQRRRLTLARLVAEEFAALITGIMKSTLPPQDPLPAEQGEDQDIPRFELIELVRGALLTLPEGYDAEAFPKQSTSEHAPFVRELLNECARSLGMPLNVMIGNSSGYNFSSGRLDHLPYHRGLGIKRNDFRLLVMDRIAMWWYEEAVMVGEIPAGVPDMYQWVWKWNWDGFDSIDQVKDADADDIRLKNMTTTLAKVIAERYGEDWIEHLEQTAREKKECERLGLPWPLDVQKTASQDRQGVRRTQPPAGDDESESRFASNGKH